MTPENNARLGGLVAFGIAALLAVLWDNFMSEPAAWKVFVAMALLLAGLTFGWWWPWKSDKTNRKRREGLANAGGDVGISKTVHNMAMTKIASTDIPFLKDADPRQQHDQAVEIINQMIEQEGLEVINIETIFARGFLGLGGQQCGLRVWHRV